MLNRGLEWHHGYLCQSSPLQGLENESKSVSFYTQKKTNINNCFASYIHLFCTLKNFICELSDTIFFITVWKINGINHTPSTNERIKI